jgi:malate permease and related proteins
MLNVLANSILPIFSMILLGYLLKAKRLIQPAFALPANQIVFYLALPAMLFNTTAQTPFKANFDAGAVISLLVALGLLVVISVALMRLLGIPDERRGTFLQSSFHGNIGFMSYAVVYYALGESAFGRAAIMSSFLMVGQNLLAVWVLTAFRRHEGAVRDRWMLLKNILQNPIILAVIMGAAYSLSGLAMPRPIGRSLDVLSGMAFPLALLLIGASLSFGASRSMVKEIIGIGLLKFICLPLAGYLMMMMLHVPPGLVLPSMILLAAPPATITYVMATELGGDPQLAATSISVLTLVSAFTYSLILTCVSG